MAWRSGHSDLGKRLHHRPGRVKPDVNQELGQRIVGNTAGRQGNQGADFCRAFSLSAYLTSEGPLVAVTGHPIKANLLYPESSSLQLNVGSVRQTRNSRCGDLPVDRWRLRSTHAPSMTAIANPDCRGCSQQSGTWSGSCADDQRHVSEGAFHCDDLSSSP